ncbi:MAG: HD-GYP domain-containing protein [Spirochaetales bacterium]|nr:MAG: HD-GYP domain-containing protein [Spirochaetales bacterium]
MASSIGRDEERTPKRREDDRLYDNISVIIDSLEGLGKLDKAEFLKEAFESVFGLIPEAQKGSLYELVGEQYRPVFCRGYDFDLLSRLAFGVAEAFIDFHIERDSSIDAFETRITGRDPAHFSPETLEIFRKLGTLSGFSSLYAPIKVEGKTQGLICLENFSDDGFSSLSRKVLKFYARLISQFYTQKLQQERETRRYKEIVDALVSAIEVMDKYTEGHSHRVVGFSRSLAKRLGLSDAEVSEIGTAAILHDVGKLGIPSDILRKPGRLTKEEFAIVQMHTANSRKILSEIQGFERIAELAYYHHERFDGKGYPEGISGDAVPFGAYVIGLADAFDAMTSNRSYRPAMTPDQAFSIIKEGSGSQFHPRIVEVAVTIFNERQGNLDGF